MIAKNVGVSRGIVSRIVIQYGQEHPDFNTLRSYVVSVKNQGTNIRELASAMRLDKRLKKLGMDQNQVEVFLDNVAEHCFKKGMTTEQFINNVNEVTRVSNNIEVPIDELQNLITDKQKELNKLKEEIIFNGILNDQLLRPITATNYCVNTM
jgi:glutaredoxin 2